MVKVVLLGGPLDETMLSVQDAPPSLYFAAYPDTGLGKSYVTFSKLEYERLPQKWSDEPIVYLYRALIEG